MRVLPSGLDGWRPVDGPAGVLASSASSPLLSQEGTLLCGLCLALFVAQRLEHFTAPHCP